MGRKTYESLPKKPLPNRHNIVITTNVMITADKNVTYMTLKDFIHWCESYEHLLNIFIIGGQSIYKQLLPYCNSIYLTKIYKSHERVDTYFPNIDESLEWQGTAISDIKEYNSILYQFWHYSRK